MAVIERFEGIEAWNRAREATNQIFLITSTGGFAKDFALRDQIRRAAISTVSNIAEGLEREGNTEFLNFLSIAKGSCAEAWTQLYIALDQKYITSEAFDSTFRILEDVGRRIGSFMRYLRSSDLKGSKSNREGTNPEP